MNGKAPRRRLRIRTQLMLGLLTIVALMTAAAWAVVGQQLVMEQSFAVHDRMHTVETWLLECRRQEKNLLLRSNHTSAAEFATALESLQAETAALRAEVRDPQLSSRLSVLIKAIDRYGLAINSGALTSETCAGDERERLIAEAVAHARTCHRLVNEIKGAAVSDYHTASAATHSVSVLSVVLGLLVSLVVSWILTRAVVRPLEQLRQLAVRASIGDIQDIDVEFSDLELGRLTTMESFELAQALRRMVTSLRLLVSSERGLMDTYHMTIVVLVSRAVGPAGWAIIERARAAAGLAAFSEVSPDNVAAFLAELEKEAVKLIPEDTVHLLCQAIEELEV